MKTMDPCVLYMIKRNMSWKDSLYKLPLEKIRAIENEIKEMHKGNLKDMQIINSTSIL